MKTKIIFILISIFIFATSCEKRELATIDKNNIVKPELTVSFSDLVLTEADADDELKFEWTKADYGANVAISYVLEIDKKDNNFKKPEELGTTSQNTLTITKKEFNNALLSLGLIEYKEGDIEMRVKSVIGKHYEDVTSVTKELSITPFYMEIDYPVVYVPGGYQGWNPADEETVLYSINNDYKYSGYLYMKDNISQGFKITSHPTWADGDDYIFGDDGTSSGILAHPGDNIKIGTTEGLYKVNADIDSMTYSGIKTDWSMYGTATSNADATLTYDETDKILKVTTDLSAGDFIFRANSANDMTYGDENGNLKLDEGNYPISISETGNYTVTIDFKRPPYKYTIYKN